MYLIGAGPGDPELLTVKAERLLREVDVVVYDRLVSDEVLARVPVGTGRIFAGKCSGHHHMPQAEINDLLVSLARAGHSVGRLKGGDPFVFGRGGEEAIHLGRHGIPFEVVPGITAATACLAYAGIPLTHRELARGVHTFTGYCTGNRPLDLDWNRFADPRATLVVYMGLTHLPTIASELISAGLDAATPAAVIENGTTGRQRRLCGTVEHLPRMVLDHAVRSPALVVIGEVVRLAGTLDWFAPADSSHPAAAASA